MLQRCILELHGILIDEELTGLRDVVPHAQGIKALTWAALFPIDHALNNLCHLVFFRCILTAICFHELQELPHLVDLLNSLNEEMLSNLTQFGEVLPLAQQLCCLSFDVDPGPVVVKLSQE